MNKPVSPINIQHSTNWTNTVSRVEITVSINGVLCPPFGLAESLLSLLHPVTIRSLAIIELYVAKIVLITTLAV